MDEINDNHNEHHELEKLNKESTQNSEPVKRGWTLYLILCCLTASCGSFQFGYNISSLNSPTKILQDFIKTEFFMFREYYVKKAKFDEGETWYKGNISFLTNARIRYETKKSDYLYCTLMFNFTCAEEIKEEGRKNLEAANKRLNSNFSSMDDVLDNRTKLLEEKKALLDDYRVKLTAAKNKIDNITDIIWTVTNALFVLGGMIGALSSKYVLDYIGRKKGILFNFLITIVASVLVFISPIIKSPECLVISRFLYGIQGGMACSLIPTYLSEISPPSLRGRTGVFPQLFITIGILFSQIYGFKEILGNQSMWHYLLAYPILPAVLGGLVFLVFFPESPKALLLNKNKYIDSARKTLELLRNDKNVSSEIDEILNEVNSSSSSSSDNVSIIGLFKSNELRWPLITSLLLQVIQQLCGINAIFFYSSSIFKQANIQDEYIQYAIAATGIVNVLTTIVCVPLIDALGRKPLLTFPMILMIIDFIALTGLLKLQGDLYSYLSIACIVIFIICFAIGLGPIPFIYVAECFRQNSRSSAMAVCVTANWISALVLTLAFPFLHKLLKENVFLVFMFIIVVGLVVIILKIPETKGKSADQIIKEFQTKDKLQILEINSNQNDSLQKV